MLNHRASQQIYLEKLCIYHKNNTSPSCHLPRKRSMCSTFYTATVNNLRAPCHHSNLPFPSEWHVANSIKISYLGHKQTLLGLYLTTGTQVLCEHWELDKKDRQRNVLLQQCAYTGHQRTHFISHQ